MQNLKAEWKRLTERAKYGSGLAPDSEPKWYSILNEVFAETNAELELVSSSKDVSYTEPDRLEMDEMDELSENDDVDVENVSETGDANTEDDVNKKKAIAAPHKKRKVVRSQQQAVSQQVWINWQVPSSNNVGKRFKA